MNQQGRTGPAGNFRMKTWRILQMSLPHALYRNHSHMVRARLSLTAMILIAAALLSASTVQALPAMTVPTQPSSAGSLDKREIRAQLAPLRYTTLAAEIGAKIQRLPVHESHRFTTGQTLIQFDCSLQLAQLNKAVTTFHAAEKVWHANQRLIALNSIGRLELDMSEAEVQKSRAEVAAHQAIVNKCTVTAPFGGRVVEQNVREQQYVQPGQSLLEILDDSELELEFIVPSRWLAWVKTNQAFEVQIDETGRSYPARVTRIAARVDPVSQSVKLTGVIEGAFTELLSGMSGRVLITPPADS